MDSQVKLEVEYDTAAGSFLFASSPRVSVSLPLGVNVQDAFKEDAYYPPSSPENRQANSIRADCSLDSRFRLHQMSPYESLGASWKVR